ncbi:MAG: SDR family NAD(P)-dependent oxidoreductase [Nitrososphaeraceae archaeon]
MDHEFNNAGREEIVTPLTDQTSEVFGHIMNVNVKGTWLYVKYEIPEIIKNEEGGTIVNMFSIGGVKGFSIMPIYVACKHSVLGQSQLR